MSTLQLDKLIFFFDDKVGFFPSYLIVECEVFDILCE